MSRIAAAMLAFAADAAAPTPLTAEQAIAAARARISAVQSCRDEGDDDAIVVCGRRGDPYALPLYDPTDDDDASKYGGNGGGQMAAIKESESVCAKQGAFCQPLAAVNFFTVLPVLIKGVTKLLDRD